MEVIVKELTIDLYGPTLRYAVEAHEGDRATRVLQITVTEDGQPFTLPAGADYIAQIRKPNAVTVYQKCVMRDNVITLVLPGNALDRKGRANCEIVMNDTASTQTLTTQSFEIEIHPKQGAANSIEASDDIPSMEVRIEQNEKDIDLIMKLIEDIQANAGLPSPTTAKVGQFIRITRVGEKGKVLAVEAVDVIGGGVVPTNIAEVDF